MGRKSRTHYRIGVSEIRLEVKVWVEKELLHFVFYCSANPVFRTVSWGKLFGCLLSLVAWEYEKLKARWWYPCWGCTQLVWTSYGVAAILGLLQSSEPYKVGFPVANLLQLGVDRIIRLVCPITNQLVDSWVAVCHVPNRVRRSVHV